MHAQKMQWARAIVLGLGNGAQERMFLSLAELAAGGDADESVELAQDFGVKRVRRQKLGHRWLRVGLSENASERRAELVEVVETRFHAAHHEHAKWRGFGGYQGNAWPLRSTNIGAPRAGRSASVFTMLSAASSAER